MDKPRSRTLRKSRWSDRGGYYFLTTCVSGRRNIFSVKEHALIAIDALRWLHAEDRFAVDAAVVMPDHIHFAGQLCDRSLGKVMHSLKSYTANRLAAGGVEAPLWQDGYHDHGLRDDRDYRVRVSYLIENPIRAGLVERVEDYPYLILPPWW